MTSAQVFLISFAAMSVGIACGRLLRSLMPNGQLDADSKEVIKLGTGLVGTLAALVLGLMTASAKTSFDTQSTNIRTLAAQLILVDQLMVQYGPEADDLRRFTREAVDIMVDRIWREGARRAGKVTAFSSSEVAGKLYTAIDALSPKNDEQRVLKSRIIDASYEVARVRLAIFTRLDASIPVPFLIVLIIWVTVIFASFSLFAEHSTLVFGALLIFALSVSSSLFLILELTHPFAGLMQIPSEQLKDVLPALSS
jgi:Protein of unknown function (DUF4239)